MSDLLLTIEQTASRLAVSMSTVRRMDESGALPGRVVVGVRGVRFKADQIDLFVRDLELMGRIGQAKAHSQRTPEGRKFLAAWGDLGGVWFHQGLTFARAQKRGGGDLPDDELRILTLDNSHLQKQIADSLLLSIGTQGGAQYAAGLAAKGMGASNLVDLATRSAPPSKKATAARLFAENRRLRAKLAALPPRSKPSKEAHSS